MHPHLAQFVANHTIKVPSATYPLKQLTADFIAQLPAKARDSWRRGRIVADLSQAGYIIALHHGVHVVAGIAPRAEYQLTNDGKLELARA